MIVLIVGLAGTAGTVMFTIDEYGETNDPLTAATR